MDVLGLQQNHGVSSRFTVSAEDLIPSAAPPARAGLEEQEDKEDDDQRLSDSPKNLLELRSSSVSASGMIRRKRVVSGSIREDIKGTGLKFNIDSEERVGDLGEANSNGTLQQPNSASKSDTIKSRKRSAGSVDGKNSIQARHIMHETIFHIFYFTLL